MKARCAFPFLLYVTTLSTVVNASQVLLQGAVDSQTPVVTPRASTGNEEDRMISDLIGPAEEKVRLWQSQGMTGQEVFQASQVEKNVLETLKSPDMDALLLFFSKHTNGDKKLIEHFTKLYGDDVMALELVMLTHSENEKMREMATKLLYEQLEGWWDSGKSISDVFEALKLGQNSYNVLGSLRLQVLEKFIDLFNQRTSSHETLLDALITGFHGENYVMGLISSAKLRGRAKDKAFELETLLLAKWRHEQLHPGTLLSRLELDKSIECLEYPAIKTVLKYIAVFNQEHVTDPFTLTAYFADKFGPEAVAMALAMATKGTKTNTLIVAFQMEQFETWWKNGYSMNKVFRLLKIPDDFSAPGGQNVYALDDFIKFFNEKTSSHETLLNVLTKGFGGEDKVAVMIEKAQDDSRMKEIAKKLKRDLLEKWLNDEESVDQVLTLLKVEEDGSDGLLYWKLQMLNAFLALYNAKNRPENPLELRSVLRKSFGESGFALFLAKTRRSSSSSSQIATDYTKWLFERWMESHLDPTKARHEIFKDVNDDEIEDILRRYAKFYNKRQKQVLRFQDPRRS